MVIFLDRLTFRNSMAALRIMLAERTGPGDETRLSVLDPIPGGIRTAMLRGGFRLLGTRIEEASFFTGHLKNHDGQSVYTAAMSFGNQLALTAAKRTLDHSPLLFGLNQSWGHSAIELNLAKSFWRIAFNLGLHLLAADALARQEESADVHHVAEIPPAIDPTWVDGLAEHRTKIHFRTSRPFRDSRLYGLIWCLAQKGRQLWCRLKANPAAGNRPGSVSPALLLLQEDEISLDRSFRTQPHWYYREDGQMPFDVLILVSDLFKKSDIDRGKLEMERIFPITPVEFYTAGISTSHPLRKRIRRDLWSLILKSIVADDALRPYAETARLFFNADCFTAFCLKERVRVFMTCENYMPQADAVRLIADDLNIHTLSYQYSNMGEVGPLMMTTADTMFSFAPLYHERWTRNGIRPKDFVDTGYLFDRSFDRIRDRAKSCREQFAKAGAKFVIGYLDESVQHDKYGLIHPGDHIGEIRKLIHHVLRDPSSALMVKTQFQRNSPRNYDGKDDLISRAAQSGRYIELSHGLLRNNIFPAEAALCSDIIIGHAVGATAALEAALTGARCIMLNPYGFKSASDPIYREADILYPSIEMALAAIEEYRAGKSERTRLGDWSTIIDRFDAFRDGRSSARLRHHLEMIIKEGKGPLAH